MIFYIYRLWWRIPFNSWISSRFAPYSSRWFWW